MLFPYLYFRRLNGENAVREKSPNKKMHLQTQDILQISPVVTRAWFHSAPVRSSQHFENATKHLRKFPGNSDEIRGNRGRSIREIEAAPECRQS
jgi:hypothetical protein